MRNENGFNIQLNAAMLESLKESQNEDGKEDKDNNEDVD